MPKKVGKVRKLSKAINRERKLIEAENSDVPKTMIFCKPNSGSVIKQLVDDFKSTMKPHTIKEVFCSRSSKLDHYVAYATKSHVKSIIYFSQFRGTNKTCDWNESTNYQHGGVYCHVIVLPHGPSFTYRVREYSLKKDIQTITGFGMNCNWLQKPPLLICEGFGNSEKTDYLKAVSSSFQNMLPTLNINKMQINSVRRALLISHQNKMPETDELTQKKLGEVFMFRHYFIKLENKELNKNIKKLGAGVSSKNIKVPDLSRFASIADFVTRTGNASESEMSDMEGEGATIELTESVKELPGSTGKTAVRLMEVGPRMTLQLLKIQEGIHSGALLYHRFVKRTQEEIFELEKKRAERLKLKEKRREQQAKDVDKKQKKKDDHKKVCLDGMAAKGYVKKTEESDEGEDMDGETEAKESELTEDESDDMKENEDVEMDEVEMEEVEDVEDIEESDDNEDASDDSDGIEDVNDSMDEDIEDVNDSLDDEDVSEAEDNGDSDDLEVLDDGSDDLEGLDDDSDEINMSDVESENSDLEVPNKKDSKISVKEAASNMKRKPNNGPQQKNKKRKL